MTIQCLVFVDNKKLSIEKKNRT